MKTKLFCSLFIFLSLLASCKTHVSINEGTFRHIRKFRWNGPVVTADSKIITVIDELILREDGTFTINNSMLRFTSQSVSCEGTWKYIATNTILIKCNPVSGPATLLPGQLHHKETEREIKIINENKLKMPIFNQVKEKFQYIILKREKED